MTDKEAIIQDLISVGNDIYAAFSGKPAKVPAVNPWQTVVNGMQTLNPFGAMLKNECKSCR